MLGVGKRITEIESFIFLDELHFVENWQEILKYYYDLNNNIHFIVTGSASLYLYKNTRESLAGRILDFYLPTLTYHEYLYLKYNIKIDITKNFFNQDIFEILNNFKILDIYFEKDFFSFLNYGEFPQIIFEDNKLIRDKYIEESILDKIFSKDIFLFQIEKFREIRVLFKVLCQNVAQFINKENISREIGLSQPTLRNYMDVLKKTFLIDYINNFLKSIRSQEKSFKKVFINSTNILGAVMEIKDFKNILYPDFFGHVLENFVFNELSKVLDCDIYFYHKNKKEIDLILVKDDKIIPVEIKSSSNCSKKDINHLNLFMRERKLSRGFYIYGGKLDIIKNYNTEIILIPYYYL